MSKLDEIIEQAIEGRLAQLIEAKVQKAVEKMLGLNDEPATTSPPPRKQRDKTASSPKRTAAKTKARKGGFDDARLLGALTGGPRTSTELASHLGVSGRVLSKAAERQMAAGKVAKTGKGRGVKYGLTADPS